MFPKDGKTMNICSDSFPAILNFKLTCFLTGTMLPLAIWILNMGEAILVVILPGGRSKFFGDNFPKVRFELRRSPKDQHFRKF